MNQTLIALKKVFIIVLLLFNINCIGVVQGDYTDSNLSSDYPEIQFTHINVTHKKPSISDFTNIPPGLKIDPKNSEKYTLEIQYSIQDEYTNDTATLLTLATLGVLPFFHSLSAEVEYIIKKDNNLILTEKETINARIYYGWIFILFFDKFPSPDQFSINEGTGLRGGIESAIHDRIARRIAKKLKEIRDQNP